MKKNPIDLNILDCKMQNMEIDDIAAVSIREIVQLSLQLEKETGVPFLHMEMGVPGLSPAEIGVQAEIDALSSGVSSIYPPIEGITLFKEEASRFLKLFMNLELSPKGCVPCVGSMQGSYATFLTASACDSNKDTVLFIDPGFPVQKMQMHVMGSKFESFDIYDYRGDKLRDKLESYLASGKINSMIYSNPNNPSWICLTDDELKIIGELANKYNVIVIEDLAYFGMDFRKNISTPGREPYQSSVSKYTNNFVLLVSSSKLFSYAGQRIGFVAISDQLFERHYDNLETKFGIKGFGNAIIYRALYSLSSGTAHSSQYAFYKLLKAMNDSSFDFIEEVKVYAKRAEKIKKAFLGNGFELVYDQDINQPIGDGFYFTVTYPGLSESDLIYYLISYGISAISLKSTGSKRDGLRICVSQINDTQINELKKRLIQFNQQYSVDVKMNLG